VKSVAVALIPANYTIPASIYAIKQYSATAIFVADIVSNGIVGTVAIEEHAVNRQPFPKERLVAEVARNYRTAYVIKTRPVGPAPPCVVPGHGQAFAILCVKIIIIIVQRVR
jgi:hypothetical protein